jgi:hypothetical protein
LGAAGSGASGSSTIKARLWVPAGTPLQASGGDESLPWQVYLAGMAPFGLNALDLMVSMALVPSLDEALGALRAFDA